MTSDWMIDIYTFGSCALTMHDASHKLCRVKINFAQEQLNCFPSTIAIVKPRAFWNYQSLSWITFYFVLRGKLFNCYSFLLRKSVLISPSCGMITSIYFNILTLNFNVIASGRRAWVQFIDINGFHALILVTVYLSLKFGLGNRRRFSLQAKNSLSFLKQLCKLKSHRSDS